MRTVVITGSASGIGRATLRFLEQRGDRVIGVDLHDAEIIADLITPAGRGDDRRRAGPSETTSTASLPTPAWRTRALRMSP